jgi:hypothetical protein
MDPMLAMLLPKGIMVNTSDIYKEVASYPVVPPEKIWEYWHGTEAYHRASSASEGTPRLILCC